ncbi:MAG: winged helix-turn-helix domain-containing protein [Saprospiraceae bacterium]
MKNLLNKLDKAFENRIRLALMSALMVNENLDFTSLKELLGLTDGNLASHLKNLENKGYITFDKIFQDRKPLTNYRATQKGKKAFTDHLDALEQLLKSQQR